MMTWSLYFIIVNIMAFLLFGLDKLKARRGTFRIKESALLAVSLLGGSPGALLGMYIFKHKTKKPLFKYGIPLFLIMQLTSIFYFLQGANL